MRISLRGYRRSHWFSSALAASPQPCLLGLALRVCLLSPPLFFPTANAALAPAQSMEVGKSFRVVLDPGHGGSDDGTQSDLGVYRISEKDVTLAIAKQTAAALKKRGIEAVLTREEDQDLSLAARTKFANELKANVFLSIHVNSLPHGGASGIETFFLNTASDASSRRLARMENSVLGRSMNDAGENLEVAMILKDLRLDANLKESKRLACQIQNRLAQTSQTLRVSRVPALPGAKSANRGVKRALFHVLLGADMPSALVETGFLTHPRDRAILLSPEGQNAYAESLAEAISAFKTRSQLSTCRVH
jgi:N-acetylmuramoyl-L-alanine amidase